MYGLPPAIAILDITMGKLSKFKPQLPFPGRKSKSSSDGERPHAEEKEKYVGPYDNTPVPRLTIHSFIMGVFVRALVFTASTTDKLLTALLAASNCISAWTVFADLVFAQVSMGGFIFGYDTGQISGFLVSSWSMASFGIIGTGTVVDNSS